MLVRAKSWRGKSGWELYLSVVSGGQTPGEAREPEQVGLMCSGLENRFPLLWWPTESFPLSLPCLFNALVHS